MFEPVRVVCITSYMLLFNACACKCFKVFIVAVSYLLCCLTMPHQQDSCTCFKQQAPSNMYPRQKDKIICLKQGGARISSELARRIQIAMASLGCPSGDYTPHGVVLVLVPLWVCVCNQPAGIQLVLDAQFGPIGLPLPTQRGYRCRVRQLSGE